mgnify:CR=1 FL=1
MSEQKKEIKCPFCGNSLVLFRGLYSCGQRGCFASMGFTGTDKLWKSFIFMMQKYKKLKKN